MYESERTKPTARSGERLTEILLAAPRHTVVAVLLLMALFAFEVFNFDTTKYALNDLLGEVSIVGLSWATILGFAFCAIDFAGLVRIFTPEQGRDEPREVWYLMGAWLLGATMNAVMTWYAVSLTLLKRPLSGSEVLTQEQLTTFVPVFVAVLVWLTRILFIGSLSVTGEQLFAAARQEARPRMAAPPVRQRPAPVATPRREPAERTPAPVQAARRPTSRVRQRPPLTGNRPPAPMRAKGRTRP